jgi:hypothetical protein
LHEGIGMRHCSTSLTLIALACATAKAWCGPDCLSYRVGDTLYAWDPRPELGIGVHQMTPEHIDLVKALGIRLVRHTLYWSQIETTATPGQYAPEALEHWDDLVRRCDAAGILLVVVVHGNAPGCSFATRQESYRRFAAFMGAMAARYRSIRYWELWNEMDSAFTDLFGAQDGLPLRERGRLYAEMLKLAYPAIRQANPQALVLTGGMTDWDEFPEGIYEGGGREVFDIMNIHTYGVPIVWAFVDRGMKVRALMQRHGDAHKPLWNTEFGVDAGNLIGAWGYPHGRGEDDAQALDRMMTEQWAACLDAADKYGLYQKILPYQLQAGNERNDGGQIATETRLPEGHTIDDYGFGILRRDGRTPRPTYDWLKERDFNRAIRESPTRRVDVEFWSWDGKAPVGCEMNRWRPHYVRIAGAQLGSDYPLMFPLTAVTFPP